MNWIRHPELPKDEAAVVREFARLLRIVEYLGAMMVCLGLTGFVVLGSASRIASRASEAQMARATDDSALPRPPLSVAEVSAHARSSLRYVYHYSVIPGGIESVAQLRDAAMHDPVVAAHYADFSFANARFITLDHDATYYVSYRGSSGIFWTSLPVVVRRGEHLVSDGANLARARCGNRLSLAPLLPVSPAEPRAEELNAATVVRDPGGSIELARAARRRLGFIPFFPFYYPPGGGSGEPHFSGSADVPRPDAFFAAGIILACVALRRRLRPKYLP